MSQFSHYPFKPEVEDIEVAYPSSGKHEGYAVLHAAGCAHTKRDGTRESRPVTDIPSPDDLYTDDYYEVAPCLRARGSKPHRLDH